jgi:hypothetical protein
MLSLMSKERDVQVEPITGLIDFSKAPAAFQSIQPRRGRRKPPQTRTSLWKRIKDKIRGKADA